MTVDEVKEWLPIFQAVADGKVVQTLRYDGLWFDSDYCGIVIGLGASNYRVKPSENNAEKEEKTHSNNFNIKLIKEFNLTEYLKDPSKKVVTRDGRNVRIICTNMKSEYPLIALAINKDDNKESLLNYKENGKYFYAVSENDLFFAPVKREGWTNVYKDNRNGGFYLSGIIFESEKEAKETVNGNNHYLTTIKIEWEE